MTFMDITLNCIVTDGYNVQRRVFYKDGIPSPFLNIDGEVSQLVVDGSLVLTGNTHNHSYNVKLITIGSAIVEDGIIRPKEIHEIRHSLMDISPSLTDWVMYKTDQLNVEKSNEISNGSTGR